MINSLTFSNGGTGYTAAPTVTFSGGTTNATATGGFSSINLTANSSIGGDGNLVIAPVISSTGSFGFTKIGAGTLTLNGTNTYSGPTNVTGGTLLANNTSGSATGSGNVTVASGATLGGIGTIGGATTITGILSPGDGGIGTLNITGGATWQGASSNGTATDWIFQLGADNTADLLHITGDFTKDTSLGTNFRFDFGGSMSPGTFKLVDWTGSSSFSANSTVSDFTYTSLGSELTGSFSIHDNQLDFTALPPVPEPSTWVAMAALIITGGILAMRRHTRQATGIM
jgi:autotransporter-associated beta strand protein